MFIMKKRTQSDYTTSLWLQGFVLFPTLFSYFLALFANDFVLFGLIFQFLLGVTQVLSGMRGALSFEDTKRAKYTLVAVGYVLLLIVGSNVPYFYNLPSLIGSIIGFISFWIIPIGIAIWYYYQTWQDRKMAAADNNNPSKAIPYREDLLDDIVIP